MQCQRILTGMILLPRLETDLRLILQNQTILLVVSTGNLEFLNLIYFHKVRHYVQRVCAKYIFLNCFVHYRFFDLQLSENNCFAFVVTKRIIFAINLTQIYKKWWYTYNMKQKIYNIMYNKFHRFPVL